MILIWGVFAFLSAFVQNYTQLLIVRFLLGVAEGGIWPAILVLISHWFPARERARAYGFWMMNIAISSIITAPLSGWILTWGDWRTLWGLGASLYAAVEGRPPFQRPGALATLTAVVSDEPDPFRHAGPLEPVISGLLRKDPGARLDTADAEQMLQHVLEQEPAAARTAPMTGPTMDTASRWAGRSSTWVTTCISATRPTAASSCSSTSPTSPGPTRWPTGSSRPPPGRAAIRAITSSAWWP